MNLFISFRRKKTDQVDSSPNPIKDTLQTLQRQIASELFQQNFTVSAILPKSSENIFLWFHKFVVASIKAQREREIIWNCFPSYRPGSLSGERSEKLSREFISKLAQSELVYESLQLHCAKTGNLFFRLVVLWIKFSLKPAPKKQIELMFVEQNKRTRKLCSTWNYFVAPQNQSQQTFFPAF